MKLYSKPWPSKRLPAKCGLLSLIIGLLLLLKAMMCAFFRTPLHDLVDLMIQKQTAMTKSSMMTSLWVEPPFNPRLHVYVYNVTNHEAFLSGLDNKIRVEEIGPYVYEAPQRRKIIHYNKDQSAVTYQSRIDYKFLLDQSGVGLNDQFDRIIFPNLLMMTGTYVCFYY